MGIALADCEKKGFHAHAFKSSCCYVIWSMPTNVIIIWKPLDDLALIYMAHKSQCH